MPLFEVRPTGAAAGAEILGVDLSNDLDAAAFAPIQAALDEYGVIVLRDQTITPEQQIALSRNFGTLEVNFHAKQFGIAGSPEIYAVSNIVEQGEPIGTRRAGEA